MFGSGFGSLASSSAFGAPAQAAPAFGAPAFGASQTGSAFGGGFGQPAAAATPLGGGGLFGTPQPQQQQSVFGQPQQAARTGMFGAAASQSSVFGQPAVSAFGATPTVGGLGTLQQQQPQTQQAQPQQPQQLNPQLGYPTTGQGSRVVQFSPETIKQADQTQQFRHICSMAQYADKSSEELRFEDYVTNCKGSVFGGNAATGGFGGGQTGFGQGFGNNTTAFGASSASTFGTPAASQSLFGAPASTPSLFGAQPASQAASIFGTPAAANTGFGATPSAFGQTQSAFGFGQQPQQQQQPGLATNTFGASSASLFGAPQQQQAGAFGQKPATGLFGQPAQTGSLFGNPMSAASTFGAASSASIFGGQQATQSTFGGAVKPVTGFGTPAPSPFGQAVQQPAATGIFGTAPAASSASIFGGGSSASLFGQSSASPFGQLPAAAGGGLFGQQQPGGFKPPGGTGLFGSGSSLFGGGAGQSSSSLFASAPAAGSLFGAPAASTSLFGAPTSPSLFGAAASQNQGTSLFGGAGMFGQAGAQQQAVAAVAPLPGQAPYGALPTVPKVPEMRSGIAASAVSRSVAVPPPVLFRPKPRMVTPVRAPKTAATPPSTDTQLSRRSPSIFKISYRDPGLVIHTPLPSTNAATSRPATSDQAFPTSPAFISPSVRGSPNFTAAVTPEIQPANGIHRACEVPSSMNGLNSSQPETAGVRFPPADATLASASPPGPSAAATQLPKLPDGWWMKPSMDDLTATVARNPAALKSVDRFTVGQAGVGSIMYLDDVDLSGVENLEDVFCFEPGSVSAYYDGCRIAKHAPGFGVNRPARVQIELTGKQMNKIMRREDSRSSEEYLNQLKLRLKSLSAGIDASFIDLQVKGSKRAVWIFEVKHWSRYGLPQEYCEDDEESDDDMDFLPWPESRQENQGRANIPSAPSHQSGLDPKQASDAGPSGMAAPADSYQLDSEDATSEALDLQESRLRVPPLPTASHASPLRSALMPLQPLRDRIPTSVTHLSPPLSAEHALAIPPSAHVPFGDAAVGVSTIWHQPRRRLQIVCQANSADNSPHADSASPWDSDPSQLRQSLRESYAASGHAESGSAALVDISAVMSTTKRACISLQGHVVQVSHTLSSTQVYSTVSIHKLQPGALLTDNVRTASKPTVTAVCDALRQRADRLLGVHAEHSTPAGGGTSPATGAEEIMMTNDEDMEAPSTSGLDSGPQSTAEHSGPHLQFRCNADAMPCKALQDACKVAFSTSAHPQTNEAKATALKDASQALGHTLGLTQRLFCVLEPADGSQRGARDAGNVQTLLSSQRKREVTQWLEDQVEREVAESIQEVTASGKNVQAVIVELLSANDVHGAAAVAVQCGLPRLAAVMCSGGLSGATRAFLSRQIAAPNGLPSWEAFRFFDSERPLMPPSIAAVYKLLAGDLSSALVFLSARQLSWQRLFAMCLWFGCGPEQPIRAALDSFNSVQQDAHAACDGMSSPHVPLPLPAHLVSERALNNWDTFTADVQFVLLQVAAKEPVRDGSMGVPLLRQLVRTRAFSGDVLDSLGAWVLLCILLAVEEAPTVHGQPDCLEDVFAQLTLDCAATLLWLGMPTWAVYVLSHLQVSNSESTAAKEALLQHVLDVSCIAAPRRNAPAVHRDWLGTKCALPQHQLARADALYALSTGDDAARGRALLDAQLGADATHFAETLAGPQHLSWKNSAAFGAWLVDCPCDNHPHMDLIQAYMQLKSTLEGRVVQDRLPECVCSDDERDSALELLRTVCGRLGQISTAYRRSLDQKAMFLHMASVLGKWLLAGAPGSISVARLLDGRHAAHMPASTLYLHNIVLGAEC